MGADATTKYANGVNGIMTQLFRQAAAGNRTGNSGIERAGAIIVLSDPDLAYELCSAPDLFEKQTSHVLLLGRNRLTTNGDVWRLRRGVTQQRYNRAGHSANAEALGALFSEAIALCDPASPDRLETLLLSASISAFHRIFECRVAVEPLIQLFSLLRIAAQELQYLSFFRTPDEEYRQIQHRTAAVLAKLKQTIDSDPELQRLMDMLALHDDAEADFDPAEEYPLLLFAGTETSVSSISWMIDRLGLYPEHQEEIHDEIASGASETPLLECFVQETLRMFPPVPFVSRIASREGQLGGLKFAAGQIVAISIFALHRNARHWTNPMLFDPRRPEFMDNSYNRRAYLPFLAGPRICGGARFAQMEIREGIKAFIRRFRVRRVNQEIQVDYALAMRPRAWSAIRLALR